MQSASGVAGPRGLLMPDGPLSPSLSSLSSLLASFPGRERWPPAVPSRILSSWQLHGRSIFFTHSCCRVSESVFLTGSHPESKATGWGRPHLNPRHAGYGRRETWYCLQSEEKTIQEPALLSRVWWYHAFSPRPGHWSGAQPRCLKPMVFCDVTGSALGAVRSRRVCVLG